MTEYTPTTDDVEFAWVTMRASMGNPEVRVASTDDASMAEFDRWFAEHTRQVAERAWDEGRMTMARDTGKTNGGTYTATPNPYRKEATADWPPPKSRDEIRKGAIDEIAEALEKKEATGD